MYGSMPTPHDWMLPVSVAFKAGNLRHLLVLLVDYSKRFFELDDVALPDLDLE